MMRMRCFLSVLLALAVAAAPLGLPAMAQAEPARTHHADMAGNGHCGEQPKPADHGRATGKDCCAAMCVAVTLPATSAQLPSYHARRERPASDLNRRGFLGEIATPPPRAA